MIQEIFHFFGRAICHQLEERSLQASGQTLSVCARCTGIYIGIFSSLIYLHLYKRKTNITIPTIKVSFFLLLFMLPMITDGLGSYLHFFESSNIRRLVSGTSLGFVLPFFLYPLLSLKSLKRESEPVIKNIKDFLVPLLLSCCLGGVVYWGKAPHYVLDGLIVLTIIIWFGLCGSFLFSAIRNSHLRWAMSMLSCLVFLTILSSLHSLIIN